MDFFPRAAAIARSPWNDFRLNMNGNIIYQVPSPARRSYGIHIHKGGNISGNWKVFLWWFHVLCSAPLARSLPSANPVISLVMWEWWSRDNGTLSFHMRQEDSLQALTCFSTGEWIASCYLHVPRLNSCQSYILFSSPGSIFRVSLVPGRRLTELSQA